MNWHRVALLVVVATVVAGAGVGAVLVLDNGSHPSAGSPAASPSTSPTASPAPVATKPPLPPRTVVHVPWTSTAYDADHPPAFPGTLANPRVPWCRAHSLAMTADWQGATGNLFGAVTVTNTSTRACAVQGQPSVAILDRAGGTLVSAAADAFYVDACVRLPPQATASSRIDWYGEVCNVTSPQTLRLTLPHDGGVLRTPMRDAPPCQADSDPSSAGHLQLHGFLRRNGNHLVATYTPEAALDASIGGVRRHVLAGNELHYRVRLFSTGRGQIQLNPCLPYREQLLAPTGAVVAEQAFVLDCDVTFPQPDTPGSGYRNFYAMHMQVPATLRPGRYSLRWQSVLEPVQATAGGLVVVATPPAPCSQSQLRITAGRGGAGLGSFYAPVVFRNVSATSCSLRGYPGVEYVDPQGAGMPTHPEHNTSTTARTVILEPGHAASVMLSASDFGPNGGATPCPRTAGVRVIAPGLTTQVFVPAGVDYCNDGHIFVSPVQPGPRPQP